MIGVNWTKAKLYAYDGKNNLEFKNWDTLFTMVKAGTMGIISSVADNYTAKPPTLVIESTFESYKWRTRNEIIDKCQQLGIQLLTISPRETAIFRGRWYKDFTTSKHKKKEHDALDAVVIYRIATETKVHLKVPTKRNLENLTLRQDYELNRREDTIEQSRVALLVKEAMGNSNPAMGNTDPDPSFTAFFFDNGKPNWEVICPFALAYFENMPATRKEFERLCGTYSAGYPSYCRATFYRRLYGTQQARWPKIKAGIPIEPLLPPRDARRAVRELFWLLKVGPMGKLNPEMGKYHPESPTFTTPFNNGGKV